MSDMYPNIYDYIDYRAYLEDYREERSSHEHGFTHYYICHKLGMKNSRSYFNNIIKGRKNIGPDTVEKLIVLIELKSQQANYFRTLVSYNQAKNIKEKEFYFDQLIQLNNTPKKIINEDVYDYFRDWYNPVIRELLQCYNFTGDFHELAQKIVPAITVKEAKKSIELLEKLGLIQKKESGIYEVTDKVICTPDSVKNELILRYQIQALGRAQERIARNSIGHKTTTMTIAVSSESIGKVLQKLDQFKASLRSISHKDAGQNKKIYEIIIHAQNQSN